MSKFELRDDEISGKRGFVLEHNGYDEGRGLFQRWEGVENEGDLPGGHLMGPILGVSNKCKLILICSDLPLKVHDVYWVDVASLTYGDIVFWRGKWKCGSSLTHFLSSLEVRGGTPNSYLDIAPNQKKTIHIGMETPDPMSK